MKNITLAEKLIMLSGAVLFALMIAVNSFCVNDNPGFRVPMTTYLIVMIALFFLDTIIGAGGPCGENHETIHAQIPK
ncbi:MAG: hypothetical protein ACLTW6_08895 [Enterobacter sp.]